MGNNAYWCYETKRFRASRETALRNRRELSSIQYAQALGAPHFEHSYVIRMRQQPDRPVPEEEEI